MRSFGDGLEHLRLSGGGERRGGGRLLRGQRHGGLWHRREIFTVSVIKSNAPGSSELFWSSAAHLDGVDVFCWGSRVRRVSGLIHGGRSRGNDRNLRTQKGATALVRDSEGQQPIKKGKEKSFAPSDGGRTCVGSGWTGTEVGCDSRDSG